MNERMRQHARKFRRRLCGLSVRCMTVAALLALVATVTPWPTVRPAHADHTGMYVVCPDPILEGNSGQMQVRWRRHHSICATIFTYSGSYTADRDDYAWFDGVWMIGDDDSDSLWVPITTKEDSKPERDETFSIGYWDGGIWHGCVITIIDDDSPEITDVEISSKPIEGDRLPNGWTNKPNDWDTYRAGESIDVTVTFDGPVEVDGSPVISLFLGDGDNNWRGARYHSGSGTDHLTFRYQVRPSDRDTDGVSVGSADVDDNREPTHGFSGTIRAKGTDAPAHLIHDGLASSPDHKVDGRPYAKRVRVTSTPPDGWSAYRANQIIEFSMNFDIDVEVNGEITMGFYVGNGTDGWRDATYVRGSGTDTLVFKYTVLPGDTDIDGVSIALGVPEHAFGGSGTITARGTDVEAIPYYVGTGPPGRPADRYDRSVHHLGRHSVAPQGWDGVPGGRSHRSRRDVQRGRADRWRAAGRAGSRRRGSAGVVGIRPSVEQNRGLPLHGGGRRCGQRRHWHRRQQPAAQWRRLPRQRRQRRRTVARRRGG